jgi:hypothetical protein
MENPNPSRLKALLMLLTFDSINVQPKLVRKPAGMIPALEVL